MSQRFALDAQEGIGGRDGGDLRHWQVGHENAVQPGGDEFVASFYVRANRHEAQLQRAVAIAKEHAAQPVAGDLDGDGLVFVGEQRDFGLRRIGARGLTDDARSIEHRKARFNAIGSATVQDDLAREGVRRVIEDFCRNTAALHALRHAQQVAQFLVFALHLCKTQQLLRLLHFLAAQVGVFCLHAHQRAKVGAGRARQVRRRGGDDLQRIGDHRERVAHHFQIAVMQVCHQHHQTQHDITHQPDVRRGRCLSGKNRLGRRWQ